MDAMVWIVRESLDGMETSDDLLPPAVNCGTRKMKILGANQGKGNSCIAISTHFTLHMALTAGDAIKPK